MTVTAATFPFGDRFAIIGEAVGSWDEPSSSQLFRPIAKMNEM
jgi:hypothetical protein